LNHLKKKKFVFLNVYNLCKYYVSVCVLIIVRLKIYYKFVNTEIKINQWIELENKLTQHIYKCSMRVVKNKSNLLLIEKL